MIIYPTTPYLSTDVEGDVALFVDDGIFSIDKTSHKFNVAYLVEPAEIIGSARLQDFLLENYLKFDLILTDQTPLLSLPNAKVFLFAAAWIGNLDRSMLPAEFGVSTVVGNKIFASGHRLRHELWDRQEEIKIQKYFYRSHIGGGNRGGLILGESKAPLFRCQFHIAIENSKSDYYISEKVIDCFRSLVVPIYWGAAKVGDYFDARGIISVNSLDEIIDACNSITPEMYINMLPYIERNYEISLKYVDSLGKRVCEIIKNNLK